MCSYGARALHNTPCSKPTPVTNCQNRNQHSELLSTQIPNLTHNWHSRNDACFHMSMRMSSYVNTHVFICQYACFHKSETYVNVRHPSAHICKAVSWHMERCVILTVNSSVHLCKAASWHMESCVNPYGNMRNSLLWNHRLDWRARMNSKLGICVDWS